MPRCQSLTSTTGGMTTGIKTENEDSLTTQEMMKEKQTAIITREREQNTERRGTTAIRVTWRGIILREESTLQTGITKAITDSKIIKSLKTDVASLNPKHAHGSYSFFSPLGIRKVSPLPTSMNHNTERHFTISDIWAQQEVGILKLNININIVSKLGKSCLKRFMDQVVIFVLTLQ